MGSRFDSMESSRPIREEPPLPTEPPFTAFVVNLPYEVTKQDLEDYFEPIKPISIRIVTDHEGKPKGFAYVEFSLLDELKDALTFSGKPIDNREVRVSVAQPSSRPARSSGIADDADQWRRSTPLPAFESRRSGFPPTDGSSGFDQMGVAGGVRSGFGGRFAPTRPPPEPSVGDTASDWRTGKPVQGRSSQQRFGFSNRSNEGGGFDNWRGRGSNESAPTERKKLDLKPRSAASSEPVPTSTGSSSGKSNPFGAAKPVDVSERERQIQEKLRAESNAFRQSLNKGAENKTASKPIKDEGSWRARPSAPSS
ncbi:Eukaryotic translation initiation factor 4B [Malassezia cuniculi]|uniref:Eukaryotic translation initiation factor 4B n=1 Tax=Malassezia cuniculi TaxID=948313 RepID=A0AAF0JCR9_9BASI|nr:Eukaryotic translation initiation factor 4B [Malassezia cuniculi]